MMLRDPSLQRTAAYIAKLALPSGGLPWFENGIIDPWDHVEAIMGLTIGGYIEPARKGFTWLQTMQRQDGAWSAAFEDTTVVDDTRAETNFVAYVATGLWHHYLVTQDQTCLEEHWPMVLRALEFVLSLQSQHGEIYWALDKNKGVCHDALITGCCSIYKSLECMSNIAKALDREYQPWLDARQRLGVAIRQKPHRFDRTWAPKSRYSMDWFYPVLTGIYRGEQAKQHITARWQEFVEPGLGCRCVVEEPWVTVAETCELVMACLAAGSRPRAQTLFNDLRRFQLEDGSWWTGYVFPDDVHWPDERPSWTAAAILLAADALLGLTPAQQLFTSHLD